MSFKKFNFTQSFHEAGYYIFYSFINVFNLYHLIASYLQIPLGQVIRYLPKSAKQNYISTIYSLYIVY